MKTCTKEGCTAKHAAKGFCVKHYAEYRRTLPKTETPLVDTTPMRLQGKLPAEKLKDFLYNANDADMEYWEANSDASPLDVPPSIRNKYPHLTFHWSSDERWKKKGKNYQGWQEFRDSQWPDGLRRGNDTFLTAKPNEKAQRYRDHVSEMSNERIRSTQVRASNVQIGSTMSDEELKQLGAPEGSTHGMSVGNRGRTKVQFGNRVIIGGGGTRGMNRSEQREMAREEIKRRKANRVYSFAK